MRKTLTSLMTSAVLATTPLVSLDAASAQDISEAPQPPYSLTKEFDGCVFELAFQETLTQFVTDPNYDEIMPVFPERLALANNK